MIDTWWFQQRAALEATRNRRFALVRLPLIAPAAASDSRGRVVSPPADPFCAPTGTLAASACVPQCARIAAHAICVGDAANRDEMAQVVAGGASQTAGSCEHAATRRRERGRWPGGAATISGPPVRLQAAGIGQPQPCGRPWPASPLPRRTSHARRAGEMGGRMFADEAGAVMMTEIRGASKAKAKRELRWAAEPSELASRVRDVSSPSRCSKLD